MISVLYIGNRLSKHGNTPTAIEVLGPLLQAEGVNVRYASSNKNKWARLTEMLLETFKHRQSTDYVLIDTYSTSNFWYAFLVSQLCRIINLKYIPILHGGGLPNRLNNNPKMSDLIFRNSFANVAPSGYLRDRFSDFGYKVKFIPNPVEIDKFRFKKRESIDAKLIWVRSFSEIYNPHLMLQIGKILKSDFPGLKILMVGPDKMQMLPTLKKEANELKLDVTFSGRLSKEEWAGRANDYDIFVNTSRIDNAPYSLVEAAALGLPIVSSNVGGIPYIFENNKTAILVDAADADAFANAIKSLISDKEFAMSLIENGLSLSSEFNWNTIKNKWFQILN